MKLEQRIDLLKSLGEYCLSSDPAWQAAKRKAHAANGWFIPEFVDEAVQRIVTGYLQPERLAAWAERYAVATENPHPRTVGLVMAGNIPLVGFHDFLSVFVSGHRQLIKPSTRDEVLIRHLVERLTEMKPAVADSVGFAERLNGCDAYIATGSNNSARYFDYYFGKYPNLIRRNRTSVAVLTGEETTAELEALADDVCLYFGLGCRNVTQLLVPGHYDFLPLLEAFKKYGHLADLTKYKNNYDYQLTILILNKKYYMSNDSILLTENESPFSPISLLHYRYYHPGEAATLIRTHETDIQCVVSSPSLNAAAIGTPTGLNFAPNTVGHSVGTFAGPVLSFGQAQQPGLDDYADGVDTMAFLQGLQ
jgi:Acyl-CoA reductase (LuxC)